MIKSLFIAGIGGFIGTVVRFVIARYFQLNYASVFPWSTFIVNVVGCFLIGLIYGVSEKGDFMSSDIRLFLTVGICGGFTTFSTFSNDAYLLMQNQEWFRFALYTSLSVFLGLIAVFFGRFIIKLI